MELVSVCVIFVMFVFLGLILHQDIDRTLDDEFIAANMLARLIPEYKPMVMAIENSGVQITSDYVKSKLLQEGARGFQVYKVLVGKPKGKTPLGRPRHRWMGSEWILGRLAEKGGCGLDLTGSG
jgi:hypothetical protein